MTDTEKNILIKLIVDDKELTATLGKNDLQFQSIIEKAEQLLKITGTSQRQPMLDQFSQQLIQLDASNADAISGIQEFITINQLTEKEISQVIQKLQEEKGTLAVGSAEWNAHDLAITNTNKAYSNIINRQSNFAASGMQVNRAGGQMTQTMGQLGYAIGDADMFFVNFRMGMMSVANNIPMVAQGFMYAANAAKVAGTTIKAELLASLAGPGGLLLAINGLMFLLNVLPRLFDNSTKEIKKQKDEVKKLKDEYAKLTEEQIKNYIQTRTDELRKLETAHPETRASASGTGLSSRQISLSPEARFGNDYEKYNLLKDQLKALKETAKTLGEIDDLNNSITQNEERKRHVNQNNLDLYKDVVAKIKEENKGLTDSQITSQMVRDELTKWIDAEKELLKLRENNSASKLTDQNSELTAQNKSIDAIINKYNIQKELNQLYPDEKYFLDYEVELYKQINIELNKQNLTLEDKLKILKLQKEIENDIKPGNVDFLKESQDDMNKAGAELGKEIDKSVSSSANQSFATLQKYYESLKFLDKDYYNYKKDMIDLEAGLMKENGLSEVEIGIYKNEALKQLDKEYFDWKVEEWKNNNKLLIDGLAILETGYDEFWQSLSDKDMTGHERWQNILKSMEGAFFQFLGNLIKQYVSNLILQAVISKSAEAASVASSIATGTAIASAYAPAAAFASIATFGAADVAGSAGMAATVGLSYLLAIPKIPGFEKGSMGVVGESGPELIAPLDTYAEGQSRLITMTMMTLKDEIRSGNANHYLSSGDSNNGLVKEMRGLRKDVQTMTELILEGMMGSTPNHYLSPGNYNTALLQEMKGLREDVKNIQEPVITEKAVNKIFREGSANSRRSRT